MEYQGWSFHLRKMRQLSCRRLPATLLKQQSVVQECNWENQASLRDTGVRMGQPEQCFPARGTCSSLAGDPSLTLQLALPPFTGLLHRGFGDSFIPNMDFKNSCCGPPSMQSWKEPRASGQELTSHRDAPGSTPTARH